MHGFSKHIVDASSEQLATGCYNVLYDPDNTMYVVIPKQSNETRALAHIVDEMMHKAEPYLNHAVFVPRQCRFSDKDQVRIIHPDEPTDGEEELKLSDADDPDAEQLIRSTVPNYNDSSDSDDPLNRTNRFTPMTRGSQWTPDNKDNGSELLRRVRQLPPRTQAESQRPFSAPVRSRRLKPKKKKETA